MENITIKNTESLTQTSSIKCNIRELIGKTTTTDERFLCWLLEENLDNDNLLTNIGDLIYTVDSERTILRKISEPFCDNIMLIKLTDFSHCEGLQKNNCFLLKKDMCGSYNLHLRSVFSRWHLSLHGVKAKKPFLLNSSKNLESSRLKGAKQIIADDAESIYKKYPKTVVVPFKVELADVDIKILLKDLPEILEILRKEHFYFLDFDITQDFAGIFNKQEMINYLLSSDMGFQMEGKVSNFAENTKVIVENNKTVGIDCLRWNNRNSSVKIYNKFICQITSPGVTKQIGNHIIDFLNCPDKRLRETFKSELAKNYGITRLEATIYNYNTGNFAEEILNPQDDCLKVLKDNKRYFRSAPFYKVPISRMWEILSNSLKNSCCIVDRKLNLLLYAYWGNVNTGKLTGVKIKLNSDEKLREKQILYVLSAFSFNLLPINFVEVIRNGECENNFEIEFKQSCYIKQGRTFFTKSNFLFSSLCKDISFPDSGLIETENILPDACREKTFLKSKHTIFELKKIEPINNIFTMSKKKREQELDNLDVESRKRVFTEKHIEFIKLREDYKNFFQQRSKKIDVEDYLKSMFNKKWKELDQAGYFELFAFAVNVKKYTFVGALVEKDGEKSVRYIKGEWKNYFVNLNNNKEKLIDKGFCYFNYNGYFVFYLPTEKPFISFNTSGFVSYMGHVFSKICNFQSIKDNLFDKISDWDEILEEESEFISMGSIKGIVKIKDCKRLEDLSENLELYVIALKEVNFRNKTRYILQFENLEDLFVSNYWLEREIIEKQLELNMKFFIKLDVLKTTPSKNMERLVFCT